MYVHRFGRKISPSSICDLECEERALHIHLEIPQLGQRKLELKIQLQLKLDQISLPTLLGKEATRSTFLKFLRMVAQIVAKVNDSVASLSTIHATQLTHTTNTTATQDSTSQNAAATQSSISQSSIMGSLRAVPKILRRLLGR